jgi:hypothetical protein
MDPAELARKVPDVRGNISNCKRHRNYRYRVLEKPIARSSGLLAKQQGNQATVEAKVSLHPHKCFQANNIRLTRLFEYIC